MRHLGHFNVHSWRRDAAALSGLIEMDRAREMNGDEARSRLVAKDLNIARHRDNVVAAAPSPIGLRLLLAIATAEKLEVRVGD